MISFLELRTLFLNDTRFLYYLTVYFRMRKSIKVNSHTKYQNMNVKSKNINRFQKLNSELYPHFIH